MKFAIIASLATAAAITNAQKAGVGLAAGEKCDYSLVGPTLHTLAVPIAECSDATNNIYNLARATAPPTPEQAATICAKCPTFVNAVSKLTWPECHMMMAGKNQTLTSYFDAMIGGCKPTADAAPVAAPVAKAGVGLAAGEKCDYSIVGPPLHKLAVPIAECSEATNNIYNLARATAPPTAEQSAAICAKCPSFVSAVSKLSWPECHMFMAGKNQTLTSYFDAMIGGCKATGEAVPAVAAVSVANSGVVGTRAGEKCDYSLVGPELHKLAQPIALCTEATDNIYNLARASAPATPEQSAAICAKCPAFVSAVTTRTWPSCFMDMGGKNQTLASYFDQMVGSCKISAVASTTVTSAGYSVKIGAFAAAAVAMTIASAL